MGTRYKCDTYEMQCVLKMYETRLRHKETEIRLNPSNHRDLLKLNSMHCSLEIGRDQMDGDQLESRIRPTLKLEEPA